MKVPLDKSSSSTKCHCCYCVFWVISWSRILIRWWFQLAFHEQPSSCCQNASSRFSIVIHGYNCFISVDNFNSEILLKDWMKTPIHCSWRCCMGLNELFQTIHLKWRTGISGSKKAELKLYLILQSMTSLRHQNIWLKVVFRLKFVLYTMSYLASLAKLV